MEKKPFRPSINSLTNDLKTFYFSLLLLFVKRIDRHSSLSKKIDTSDSIKSHEIDKCQNEQLRITELLEALVQIDLERNPLSLLISLFNKTLESENLCHFQPIDTKPEKDYLFSEEAKAGFK